jgi:pectate lyase
MLRRFDSLKLFAASFALALAAWIPSDVGAQTLSVTSAAKAPEPGQFPPLPPRLPQGLPPAFPGAWGGGMFATGGRGGRVIEVTNLNDSGPGSLREALGAEGPRIVVFRVAGTIQLTSGDLDVDNRDVTIAGQSAPGDGICIAGDTLNLNAENIICRHLRIRRGNPSGGQGDDCIGGNPAGHLIVDHCSASWGKDENLSLYRYMVGSDKRPANNLTVQYCITSEALGGGHAFGGTWGGVDSTFHHNLFACNTGRNCSIGMSGEFDYRNNVVFNWQHRTIDGGDETSMINVINCYYKAGPTTRDNMKSTIARMEQRNMFSPGKIIATQGWYAQTPTRPGKWYVAGTYFHDQPEVTADNWKGMVLDGSGSKDLARVNTPFEGWPVNQQPALDAYESVLASAGATLPKRDAVDARVIEMVRTGKTTFRDGIISDPEQVGGYPELTYDPATLPADTDHDGMSDAWETEHKLDPKTGDDGPKDADRDGYTNVEEFLNGTNPEEAIDYSNLGNNKDTISG